MKKLITFVLLTSFFVSCSSDSPLDNSGGFEYSKTNPVQGLWELEESSSSDSQYKNREEFTEDFQHYYYYYDEEKKEWDEKPYQSDFREYTIKKDTIYWSFGSITYKIHFKISNNRLTLTEKDEWSEESYIQIFKRIK